MKITDAFVAVRADGEFMRVDQVQTMVGQRNVVDTVLDIEQATTFRIAAFVDRDLRADYGSKFKFVPVEIRREVILKGFGT